MKILNSEKLKICDRITCEKQNIQIKDLINRASLSFTEQLISTDIDLSSKTFIFCGPGNNGADGIAIAKLLYARYCDVELILLPSEYKSNNSESFKFYLDNPTDSNPFPVHIIKKISQLKEFEYPGLVIDAILGTGISRKAEGIFSEVIEWINNSGAEVVSVDIPSGISADNLLFGPAVNANLTITFQLPKFTFFIPKYAQKIGKWIVVDIGCDTEFIQNEPVIYNWIDQHLVKEHLKTRDRFSHKGTFGHSYIISGSHGKVGATILCSKAALRIGSGLVTIHAPECAYEILQMTVPEAMVDTDHHKYYLSEVKIPTKCNAIAIGPGMGTQHHTQRMLDEIFCSGIDTPMVIDADGLNLMSLHPSIKVNLPKQTIITPHTKEFERLFGTTNDFSEQLDLQRKKSMELDIFIILKGGFTTITCPKGNVYFNTNGNPGMATGGSGDVLTGMLVGLLAQGYTQLEACIIGVFLHGLAGDLAVQNGQSFESLIASDLIEFIGMAFRKIRTS